MHSYFNWNQQPLSNQNQTPHCADFAQNQIKITQKKNYLARITDYILIRNNISDWRC